MKEQVYDVDYFLRKFSAIPENMWLIGSQGDMETKGNLPHCALGWCKNKKGYFGRSLLIGLNGEEGTEDGELARLFIKYGLVSSGGYQAVAYINNGMYDKYQQPTPKQRILAALNDIKAMQENDNRTEPKVIYKVVEVDSKVKQLTKEKMFLS